ASKGNPTDAVDRLLVELGQPFLHLLGKGRVKQPFDHDREPQRRQEIAHGAAAGAGVAVVPGVILPGAVMAGAVVVGVVLPAAGAGAVPPSTGAASVGATSTTLPLGKTLVGVLVSLAGIWSGTAGTLGRAGSAAAAPGGTTALPLLPKKLKNSESGDSTIVVLDAGRPVR